MSVEVYAQNYDFKVEEDDTFVWEITELNKYEFKRVFGFEPAFENGDKTRRIVQDVEENEDGWYVTVEFWDFQDDWDEDGAIIYEQVYDNPGNFRDNIFLPTPVDQYLEEASKDLPSNYLVEGQKVTIRETDYNRILEYDANGVLLSETYENKDGIVLVKVENTLRVIPMGNFFIGFIILAVLSIIVVMIKKKKYSIIK
ncbi:MAG: hypothetical protein ACFFDK_14080 [Promethearchaeota archaeon]